MTRIVVTGAAGFIGSNIIKGLNARGIDDIIAVDELTHTVSQLSFLALHQNRARRKIRYIHRL